MKALATIINSIAWPITIVAAILVFRPQVASFLHHISEGEFLGFKFKMKKAIEESAREAEASSGLSKEPSQSQLDRSRRIAELAAGSDLSSVEQQVAELAREYKRIRASMRPGDERTRRMEVSVAKMRTMGRAAYPIRYKLAASASPGERLQAIACLQIEPDYDLVDWLAERVGKEKPFVGYHALVALNIAAEGPKAVDYLQRLGRAADVLSELTAALGSDTDRVQMRQRFQMRLRQLGYRDNPA